MPDASASILMFHRVIEDAPVAFGLPGCTRIRGTAMTMKELGRFIEGLGPIQPLKAIEDALREGHDPPAGTVLSFDDGYREHLDAARWLADRGMTATFYIATGIHSEGLVAPVDAWYWLLDHARNGTARVGSYEGRVDTLEGKRAWVTGEPKAAYLDASPEEQQAMLAELGEGLGVGLPADLAFRLYLSRRDWTTLRTLGMTVGAHSVTHPRLTGLDDEALRHEVFESLRELPGPFAYPDGDYDDRVLRVVREAGATSSVTCAQHVLGRAEGLLELPRRFVSTPDGAPCEPNQTSAS